MADSRRKELKTCGVCGDHALGSNFNAITCESCKAFFRRNALKKKEFKCPFDNNCKVDIVTRRFCQRCRLKKCFEIGMKKEWIMTDEEKKAKRKKIEKNREKKKSQQVPNKADTIDYTSIKVESPDSALNNSILSPLSALSPLTPQTPSNVGVIAEPHKPRMFVQPLTPSDYEYSPPAKVMAMENSEDVFSDTTESSQCDSTKSARLCTEVTEKSVDSPGHHISKVSVVSPNPIHPITCSILKEGDNSSVASADSISKSGEDASCSLKTDVEEYSALPDSVYMKAVLLEFTEVPLRNPSNTCRDLTPLECAKIEELVVANAILKMPLACGISDPSLLDVINMTDHAIRRLIKMSKKITAFKNLCQNDQIALLKGSCTELMILRSVMSYDPEKECWRGPQGPKRMSIKVDILKEAKGNVYEEHKRFINSFQPQWRTDEKVMLILSGITLFTPERPNLIHKEIIKLEQDTYYYLLRRYLESIYSRCEAKSSYLKLIHKVLELRNLNENHVRVYLDVNPKDVEPLLIEIFDLSH